MIIIDYVSYVNKKQVTTNDYQNLINVMTITIDADSDNKRRKIGGMAKSAEN